MKREERFGGVLRAINHYFSFFLVVAFIITCCTSLFVSTLSKDLGIVLTRENVNAAAKLTFWNVVLITLLFTVIDTVRRKLTVERPVKHITEAMEKMMLGDFSVRVAPVSRLVADDRFNDLINGINKMAEELSGVETLRTDLSQMSRMN